jgi:hypothetical protein
VHSKRYTSLLIGASTPPCIGRDLLSDLVYVPLAVVDAYVAYRAYIWLSIQLGNLTSIMLVWQREGCAAGAVVRVDNDREVE